MSNHSSVFVKILLGVSLCLSGIQLCEARMKRMVDENGNILVKNPVVKSSDEIKNDTTPKTDVNNTKNVRKSNTTSENDKKPHKVIENR